MVEIIIRGELADKLRRRAEREHQTVKQLLAAMLSSESAVSASNVEPNPEAVAFAALPLRQKLYTIARRYWQKMGDTERLALSDRDLDAQFWMFDENGIPRLKSDQGKLSDAVHPLKGLIGLIDSDETDLSTSIRETLAQHTDIQYGWTLKRDHTD